MSRLTVEALKLWAEAMGVSLSAERAAGLVAEVDVFGFSRELEALVSPDVMPATVFDVDPGDG